MNSIAHRLLRKKEEPYYAIYFPYDIQFDLSLAEISNAIFFTLINTAVYKNRDAKLTLPEKFVICDQKLSFKPHQKPHIVVCNHRRQIGYGIEYSGLFHCPIILIDHESPSGPNDVEILQSNIAIEHNANFSIVSLSENISNSWKTNIKSKFILDSDKSNWCQILDEISLRTYIR